MYRIGFDAKRLFNNFTGLGNYSRTLVQNLANYFPENDYYLFTPKVVKNGETQFFLNSPLFTVQQPRHGWPAWWRTAGIKKDLRKHHIQLFHGLSHEIPVGIRKTGIKSVVTIHDLLFKRFTGQYNAADRYIYDLKFRYACRNADRIIAISEATKTDIMNDYGIPEEKIRVVYQSCNERFMQERSNRTIDQMLAKYNLPRDYLLYVGAIVERKNLLGVVKALEILPASVDLPLVVVGRGGQYEMEVKNYLSAANLAGRVLFIQPDFADLPPLYQQADVFVYPSFGEGFGIPILEALFSETPVVTSNLSSLPEAAGPHSCLIDPASPEAIAAGIEKVLTDSDYRSTMIREGYQYAQRFKGEPLTRQLMGIYDRILGG